MKYKTEDGAEFAATSPSQLVEQLRASSRTPSTDIDDFMKQTARRCRIAKNCWIRTIDPDSFIKDLEQNGFILPIK